MNQDEIYIPGKTGTSEVYLQHYGVKGMHWGTKRGKAIATKANAVRGTGVKAALKDEVGFYRRLAKHPIVSTKVAAINAVKHPILNTTSPLMMKKKHIMDVDNIVANNKARKKAFKEGLHSPASEKAAANINKLDKQYRKTKDKAERKKILAKLGAEADKLVSNAADAKK